MSENAAVAAKPTPASWWGLVKTAISSWIDDYAPSMGAALSYYTVFSLAPLLLIVISVAGLVFGEDAVRGELFNQLQGLMGGDAAKAIQDLLASVNKPGKGVAGTIVGVALLLFGATTVFGELQDAVRGELFSQLQGLMGGDAAKAIQDLLASVNKPGKGVAGTIVGVALLLFGATTVFGELQDALDRIWRAPAREKGGLWSLLRARLLSFGLILGLAFLLMVSLVLGAAISALGKWWGSAFGGWETLLQIVNLVVGFGLTTLVFAMIYKLMPRVHVRWHDVWLGAIVTAALFSVGKFLIGLYIGKSGVASGFGAAGSLIVILLWVYYSAQIFLVGAEFTWVYAKTFGSLRGVEGAAEVSEKAAGAGEAPARSADPPGSDASPATPDAEESARPAAARPRSLVGDVGAGLAFALALRFIVPRLLRRF